MLALTLFNAVLGLRQEGKAAAAVAALQQMMIVRAKVRRDGQLTEIPAEQLVPGDVVAIEAGDIIPADGRLLKGGIEQLPGFPGLRRWLSALSRCYGGTGVGGCGRVTGHADGRLVHHAWMLTR